MSSTLEHYPFLINGDLITMSCGIVMKTLLDDWEVRKWQKQKKKEVFLLESGIIL